jgi:hypothetical protein
VGEAAADMDIERAGDALAGVARGIAQTVQDVGEVVADAARNDITEATRDTEAIGEAIEDTAVDIDRYAGPAIDRFETTREAAKDIEAVGEALEDTAVDIDRYVRSPTNAARSDLAEAGRLARQGPAVRGVEVVGEALASAAADVGEALASTAVDVDSHAGPAREVAGDAANGVLRVQDAASRVARDAANGVQAVGEATSSVIRDTANGAERLGDAASDAASEAVRNAVASAGDIAQDVTSGLANGAEAIRDAASAHVRMYRDPSRERSEETDEEQDE